jgi:phosphatidyl-myo-inositol dimannoside synthase
MTDRTPSRLLVLTPDFPPAFGGIQLVAGRLVQNFHRLDARVVTFDHAGAESVDRNSGLDVVRVPRSPVPKTSHTWLNIRGFREAFRFQPDVVLSVHIIVAPAATLIQRQRGTPFALYLHADELPSRPHLTPWVVKRADANIAVSSYTRQLALEAGADPGSIHQIPPGVDIPPPSPVERERRPTVVSVARLTDRYKGHDVLIRAMHRVKAEVPDAVLVVVGDGPLLDELVELARSEGLADSVRFTGSVPDEERDEWLDRAHVFAMPSRLPPGGKGGEGFGIAYLEAGAHGLPVVGGDVAGALDAIVDGETGLLVDPTDPGAVAEAVSSLLLDRDRAERLGRAGAARARAFAWPRIASRVEELLVRLGDHVGGTR